jgi:DNA-binding response OmpR family regulator
MTRVLLAEDDVAISEPLARALRREGYDVTVREDGNAALETALEGNVDLLVLDLGLPGMDGLEVCRRLRADGHGFPVLVLTARADEVDTVVGLDAGADDYVTKPFRLAELLARVRALLRRREGSVGGALSFGDLRLDLARREAQRGERRIELTTKEFELLALFMRHPRQVLTRDVILEHVWGYDFAGDANVLEVYVGYLRNKLEEGGEPRLIQTVRGAGYVLREA